MVSLKIFLDGTKKEKKKRERKIANLNSGVHDFLIFTVKN